MVLAMHRYNQHSLSYLLSQSQAGVLDITHPLAEPRPCWYIVFAFSLYHFLFSLRSARVFCTLLAIDFLRRLLF